MAAHEASTEGAEADAVAIQARLALSGAADRAATLGAHEQAVSYLRQAIAITADPAERAALHLRAAASANAAALHADAEALVQTGIELARAAGDPGGVGTGEALLGEILIDAGQPPESAAVLEAAVAAFPATASAEVRATLLANLSRAFMRSNRWPESIEAGDLALDLAEHLGLERLIAETLNNKGSALSYLGRRHESIALLKAAVDIAHEGGYVAAEIRALNNLAGSLEDGRQARDAYRGAAELARRVGNRNMARWASEAARFEMYILADDWGAALADGADIYTGDPGSPLDQIRRTAISSNFRNARGEPSDEDLARLEELSTQSSDPFAGAAVHSERSHRAWFAGDYAVAADEAIEAAQDGMVASFFLNDAMRAALWGRDLARVRDVAQRIAEARETGITYTADRLAARAGIAALEGRLDEAIAGYREAMAGHRSVGTDFEVARIALNLVFVVAVDHPSVREAAAEARAIFERIRARPYLERLDAAMARLAPATPKVEAREGSAAMSTASG